MAVFKIEHDPEAGQYVVWRAEVSARLIVERLGRFASYAEAARCVLAQRAALAADPRHESAGALARGRTPGLTGERAVDPA